MRLKAIRVELLWLLSCYALVMVIYGLLTGIWSIWQGTLDIQMHNTYFVINHALATVPLFVVIAWVVTSARAIVAPLRTRYTWAVLLLLNALMVLIILLIVMIKKSIHK
ncbi:hypothetical protein JAO77_21455 [Hymenobacter sp. BT559]|nr:hypothetical protein [Hymenobacter sp. BT559]